MQKIGPGQENHMVIYSLTMEKYDHIEYTREPTFIDLFSGCGGLSLGFLMAGYRGLLALDSDPQAVECYNFNLKGTKDQGARLMDLHRFKKHDQILAFLKKQGVSPGDCDVLIGGPPCQSFSVVGRNKIRALMQSDGNLESYWNTKNNERTSLFNVYVKFLEVIAPRWFLFENVPTIQNHKIFPRIQERFNNLKSVSGESLSYRIFPAAYLASEYGVPQDRKRFIMVGYREDLPFEEWISPDKKPIVTVEEAIGDLPSISAGNKIKEMEYEPFINNPYQEFMRTLPGWELSPGFTTKYVYEHICRTHNKDDIALFKAMAHGAKFADPAVQKAVRKINPKHKLIKYSTEKFKDKLHKLDPKRPSWTVTAHLQKDCYKFIHYRDARTITVREAARLQSFPDWFRFDSLAMCPSFRLIGNAVPPLLGKAFAESFIETDLELGARQAKPLSQMATN